MKHTGDFYGTVKGHELPDELAAYAMTAFDGAVQNLAQFGELLPVGAMFTDAHCHALIGMPWSDAESKKQMLRSLGLEWKASAARVLLIVADGWLAAIPAGEEIRPGGVHEQKRVEDVVLFTLLVRGDKAAWIGLSKVVEIDEPRRKTIAMPGWVRSKTLEGDMLLEVLEGAR